MTLKQKREIVRRFIGGESCEGIGLYAAAGGCREKHMQWPGRASEQVLRDYLNGKFSLTAAGKGRS